MILWRDLDSEQREFGVIVRRAGIELHLGHRCYHVFYPTLVPLRERWRQNQQRRRERIFDRTGWVAHPDHKGI